MYLTKLFCNHDYELLIDFEMKSSFEIILDSGKIPTTFDNTKRTHVTDYKCKKCGNLKRFIVKN